MAIYRLVRGLVIQIGDRKLAFQREINERTVQFEDIETGAYRAFKRAELVLKIADGRIAVLQCYDGGETISESKNNPDMIDVAAYRLAPKQQTAWERRQQYVRAFRRRGVSHGDLRRIKKLLPEVARKLEGFKPPSAVTIYRWLRSYQKSGGNLAALLSRHVRRSSRFLITEETRDVARDVLRKHYFIRNGESLVAVHRRYKSQVQALAQKRRRQEKPVIEVASLSTMRRIAAEVSGYDRDRARLGASAASAKWRHAVGGVYATRPLERVEMDHTILDLYVIDDVRGIPLGRPTVTILIDSYSGYILALYVSFEGETLGRMARSIQLALQPKDLLTDAIPTRHEWLTPGLWEVIVVDNGLAFQSPQLRMIALELGCDLEYCPTRKPWFKPTVERSMLEMARILPIQGRPEKIFGLVDRVDPVKTACVMFSDLCTCLTKWVVDVHPYHTYERKLARPVDLLQEGMKDMPAPAFVSGLKSLEVITGLAKEVTVRQYGVELFYLSYRSPGLADVARQQATPTFKTMIKYDPNDLGRIWVQNPRDRLWLEVPCMDQQYAKGLTFRQHKMIREYARQTLRAKMAPEEFLRAQAELQDMLDSSVRRGKGLIKDLKKYALFQGMTSLTLGEKPDRKNGVEILPEQVITQEEFRVAAHEIPSFQVINPDTWMR